MCGLFGFVQFGNTTMKDLTGLTNSLANQSAVRGTDATGIAFNSNNRLAILKESKSAYNLDFKHPENIRSLIGHTRHSTQGSEKKNYNNHPFSGKCRNSRFALAHNGVLFNDDALKERYHLYKTKIETDSYVAVQLLEYKKALGFDSIKFMAEQVNGSFSFSILDEDNSIYLVKGDSPITLLRFPKEKIYVFASTAEILWKSLVDSSLFDSVKSGEFEEIKISEGDILRINMNGTLDFHNFNYSDFTYTGRLSWWEYKTPKCNSSAHKEYMEALKSEAEYMGYTADLVDELHDSGLTLDEIEEYLYYGGEF